MAIDHGHILLTGIASHIDWQKAPVFLDRDGVINKEIHLLHRIEDLALLPGTSDALRRLNQAHHPVFIVTNQTIVARGLSDEKTARAINERLLMMLTKEGLYIVALYCCLHSERADIAVYRKKCTWRKPASGILFACAKDYQVRLAHSFVVGDQARDILMGQEIGATTILVLTGHAGKDVLYAAQADFVARDLAEAVELIVSKEP